MKIEAVKSKKYFRREARPSKIKITRRQNDVLVNFICQCRNEDMPYGEFRGKIKAGEITHLYFTDSVPVEIIDEPNEPGNKPADVSPSQSEESGNNN